MNISKRRNSAIIVKLSCITMFVICIIALLAMQMQYNELLIVREDLEQTVEKQMELKENYNRRLSEPITDEYIIRVARERLNLCMPDEIIYYYDVK